jgi:hypothetical protein
MHTATPALNEWLCRQSRCVFIGGRTAKLLGARLLALLSHPSFIVQGSINTIISSEKDSEMSSVPKNVL